MSSAKVFLLSPADVSGVRARQLCSPRANFPAARLFQSTSGVPIGQAFSFMSGLYFRGKIAYARRFTAPPDLVETGIYVIAPGFGLVSPEWTIDDRRMKRLRRVPVDPGKRAYRKPLEEHAAALAARLPAEMSVVLLGSIATGKYVDLLWPIFGDRLVFPRSFVGIGDMSRGALMLAAARSGEELDYMTFTARNREKGA